MPVVTVVHVLVSRRVVVVQTPERLSLCTFHPLYCHWRSSIYASTTYSHACSSAKSEAQQCMIRKRRHPWNWLFDLLDKFLFFWRGFLSKRLATPAAVSLGRQSLLIAGRVDRPSGCRRSSLRCRCSPIGRVTVMAAQCVANPAHCHTRIHWVGNPQIPWTIRRVKIFSTR